MCAGGGGHGLRRKGGNLGLEGGDGVGEIWTLKRGGNLIAERMGFGILRRLNCILTLFLDPPIGMYTNIFIKI